MELMQAIEKYAAAMKAAEYCGNEHGDVDVANNAWHECKKVADKLKSLTESENMGHTRSCTALTPGGDCTCCLEERNVLGTEQAMHRAWRKRAEEAEIENERLRGALTDIAESKSLTATPPQMVRALQNMAREALTPNVQLTGRPTTKQEQAQ